MLNISPFLGKLKIGTLFCIRNKKKLEECLNLTISSQTTKFVLHAHCDTLYFAPDLNGLNLDQVDTTSFPQTAPSPALAAAGSSIPPALAIVSPADIFNYKDLPSNIRHCYNDHQDPNKVMHVQDMTQYIWPDGSTQFYYMDPSIIGSHVILQNGAVLEGQLDYKKRSHDPPCCLCNTTPVLCAWYRAFNNQALTCG